MPKTKLPYMQGIKMRAFPSRNQIKILRKNLDAARFIYNKLLANSWEDAAIYRNQLDKKYPLPPEKWRYTKKGKLIERSKQRPTGLQRITPKLYPWLADPDLDSDMFTNTEVHYRAAWNMFRKVHNAGIPKFKRKYQNTQSYSTSNHYQPKKLKQLNQLTSLFNGSIKFVNRNHIRLPKVGLVKVKLSRPLPENELARLTTVTIKHDAADNWFVSILVKSDQPFNETFSKTNSEVGIDLNLVNYLTDSNNLVVDNPRYYRLIQKRLRKEQRTLSRRARRAKKDGRKLWESKNYQKQRLLVAQLHEKVRNQRENFLHRQSTALIKNHDLVVSEDLRSKNMLKDHAHAMSISDAGWRTLIQMLEYKAPKYGKTFVKINPAYTTQTCYDCGFRMGTHGTHKLTKHERDWTCPNCGIHHLRDYNAAKNILRKGYAELSKPIVNNPVIFN